MGDYKEEKGTTRVGDFLRSLGNVGKPILKAAAGLTGQEWLSNVVDGIKTSKELSEEQKNYALELHTLDAKDRASAREMNIEIQKSEHSSWLAKNTGYILDMASILIVAGILVAIFTTTVPEANSEIAYLILGYVINECLSTWKYHRGSSEGSKSKTLEMFRSLRGKR